MVGQQSSGKGGGGTFDQEAAQSIQEAVSVSIGLEDLRVFHPPNDDAMEGTGASRRAGGT